MPTIEIDYTNTIFYKIYCKNPNVTDLYIGHTTNFVQRKCAHKQSCLNSKSPGHTCKLYNVIRDHGGWDNWKMDIIAFHDCDDLHSARTQEQHYFEEYKATLNSIEPLPKPKPTITIEHEKKENPEHDINPNNLMCDNKENNQYSCEKCHFSTYIKSNYTQHIKTKRHMTKTEEPRKYICELCSFVATDRSNYVRHLNTNKHKVLTCNTSKHECHVCGKGYSHRPSLSRHLKTCKPVADDHTKVMDLNKEMLYQLFCQVVKEHNVMLTNSADST